jgi:hypothetical protein
MEELQLPGISERKGIPMILWCPSTSHDKSVCQASCKNSIRKCWLDHFLRQPQTKTTESRTSAKKIVHL